MPLIVEFGPTEHGREGKEQQHTIEQNKPADSGVAILAQNHRRHKPHRRSFEM